VEGGIPAQRLVDNLWITRYVTNDFTFSLRFSTLAQAPPHHLVTFPLWRRKALFVNANRYENDSHSAFFLWTKKIPEVVEDFSKIYY
jgi:hypothetical protein